MSITIGADPELFVRMGDKITSAIGVIGGDKYHPRGVRLGAVQEDNVLAEFNIDPVANADDFVRHIAEVTGQLSGIVAPMELDYRSHHIYERKELMAFGTQAMRFGCDPDFNCWTGEQNKTPSPYTELRTAGGHIHVGYENPDEETSRRLAQVMEYTLGLPSVCMDDDTVRRSLYGGSGAYRIKPYGVEYRVLSNFWLRTEELQRWAYKQAHDSVAMLDQLDELTARIPASAVQRIINESDTAAAICATNELGIQRL